MIPLFITEANLARDLPLVTQEEWMAQMTWYDDRLREDYYVVGAHLFTLGSGGGWANYEFTEWLPALIQHIINLKDAQDPTWPEEGVEPTPPPTDTAPYGAALQRQGHPHLTAHRGKTTAPAPARPDAPPARKRARRRP